MIEAFHCVPGGYEAQADSAERQILSRLAADVAQLLGYPLTDLWHERRRSEEAHATRDELSAYEADLYAEDSELADLAAQLLQRAERDEAGIHTPSRGAPLERTASIHVEHSDPAYRALMPAAWESEEEAQAFRDAYGGALGHAKAEALALFYYSLIGTNTVNIDNVEAVQWAQAATSIRLVLGERLGIHSDEDAEALAAATESYMAEKKPPELAEEWKASMALAYAMVSWWQDSLVQAMRRKMLRG